MTTEFNDLPEYEGESIEYITAKDYLENKGILNWSRSDYFYTCAKIAIRIETNVEKLPTRNGEIIYGPDDIKYLNRAFKFVMGL